MQFFYFKQKSGGDISYVVPTKLKSGGGRVPPVPHRSTPMTLCGESRKEATSPMPFLSTKEISKVGTWNVRTMYEASTTAQIAREKRAYNISILGLCETRWTKSGQIRPANSQGLPVSLTGFYTFYSPTAVATVAHGFILAPRFNFHIDSCQ